MFERFTRDAREVVVGAQQVARETRSATIDTRHLLVAMLDGAGPVLAAVHDTGLAPADVAARARRAVTSGDPLDDDALAAVGIDVAALRRRTDRLFGEGALDRAGRRPARRGGHVPFTRDAKKALELSLREAVRLHDRSIGTRHLLLGLLRADCPGGRVLEAALHDAGSDVPTLRDVVERAA
ncbi:ClpA/ClpB-like protein [Isoptericola jiangsuensis]|uniref:ClpA/ClpB-like protein n=1 Tax=Isoptericola jiangsuensis TaxID=548579 RepID=A0A2A9EUV7_9MICO|nr:Clp protease N-terminal domain-containing protein [Isoptericola jiangsuensis]PFG42311.1 ClpA/ClpB-like protein [Isoptericola jiangsuensis]